MKTFNEKCWELLKQIPSGKITTYKEIARILNSKGYRAVGNAMSKNPNPIIIPCHRVVKTDGKLGGYAFGVEKKKMLLKKEGVKVINDRIVDFEKVLYKFK